MQQAIAMQPAIQEAITSEHALVVDSVTRRFGDLVAVNDLSFDVQRGELFGLLGPNGAGKTTTINLITGLLHRDAGEIQVLNRDPATEAREVRRRIGLVPQETNLYADLSALDNLWHHAALYCPDLGGVEGRMEELLRLVELNDMAEADALCDRLVIIDHGRAIALDTPENLKAGLGRDIVTLRTTPSIEDPETLFAGLGVQAAARPEPDQVRLEVWSRILPNAGLHRRRWIRFPRQTPCRRRSASTILGLPRRLARNHHSRLAAPRGRHTRQAELVAQRRRLRTDVALPGPRTTVAQATELEYNFTT